MTFDGGHKAQYGFAEGRLPRTVGADHTDEFAGVDGKTDVFERNDAGKSKRRVIKVNDRFTRG